MRLKTLIFAIFFCWVGQASAATKVNVAVRQLVAWGVEETTARSVVERWAQKDAAGDPRALLQVFQRAMNDGAPVDLVVDKAAEGLAKGVFGPRLLSALDDWGKNTAQAARLARVIRQEIDPVGVSERETILRLGILQRTRKDDAWLQRLGAEAKQNGVSLRGFLRISEAVVHLNAGLGLNEKQADELGDLWVKKHVLPQDVNKYLEVIERRNEKMSVSEAARVVSENVQKGASSEDALNHLGDLLSATEGKKNDASEKRKEARDKSDDQSRESSSKEHKSRVIASDKQERASNDSRK